MNPQAVPPPRSPGSLLELAPGRATRHGRSGLDHVRATLRTVDGERRRLLSLLASAQERERERVAQELHGDAIEILAAVQLRLGALRAFMEPGDGTARLSGLEELVELAADRIRKVVGRLTPGTLDTAGLVPALRAYLADATDASGRGWRVENALRSEPPPTTRVLAYRVCVEAVADALRAPGSGAIIVAIAERCGGVHVRIHGDPPLAGAGRGVEDVAERVSAAGGWLRIDDDPATGTTVECWLPPLGA